MVKRNQGRSFQARADLTPQEALSSPSPPAMSKREHSRSLPAEPQPTSPQEPNDITSLLAIIRKLESTVHTLQVKSDSLELATLEVRAENKILQGAITMLRLQAGCMFSAFPGLPPELRRWVAYDYSDVGVAS